jgi:GDPmannose 4,6-dehydratase
MAKTKRAFITGITGQDGSYLTEFLLEKGYEVAGFVRRNAGNDLGNIKDLTSDLKLYHGDLQSPESIALALLDFQPTEIYNLAAQSSPLASFTDKFGTMYSTGIGAVQVFERAKQVVPQAKIYQASTSEMFGAPPVVPQDENTPFAPANPYAAAKLYAHNMARIARNDKNNPQFIACGILFNHESPRRGLNFVTRKVTAGVACIKNRRKKDIPLNEIGQPIVQNGKLKLGYLGSKRDWGYSKDYVEAMWLMLQQDKADDFVIATGEVHTVEDLCKEAFAIVGLDYKDYIETDPNFIPPVETGPLCGDPSKAQKALGWKPKVTFKELIKIMVTSDLAKFA